jgi:hypothetical protein
MLNKSWMTKLGMILATGMIAGVASAQLGRSYNNGSGSTTGISVRIGAFLPLSSAGTDIGSEWFAGGLDYKLSSVATANPASVGSLPSFLSISGDYYEKEGNRTIPVALNYNVKMNKLLYAVGAGVEDAQLNGGTSTISFAAQAAVSYDLSKAPIPIFLQAKYFYSNHEEFRGIGVFLGARF